MSRMHHQLLGLGRLAGDAEAARPLALRACAPPAGQRVVLAVLGQGDAEAGGVLQGPAHEAGVLHAGAVVGEQPHARGRPSRPSAPGARPARPTVMAPADVDVAQRGGRPSSRTSRTTAAQSMAGSVLGMATTAVKPPRAAARRAGLDGLGLLPAGLAEVGVQVDEAGRDDAAAAVEHVERRRARRGRSPTATMRPSRHEHVGRAAPRWRRPPCRRVRTDVSGSRPSTTGIAEVQARAEQPEQDRHAHGHAVGDLAR